MEKREFTNACVEWDRRACDLQTHHYLISRIVLPEPTCDTARFVALHEYAHCSIGVTRDTWYGSDDDEIAASRLALRWIKPSLKTKALRFYLSCIAPSAGVRKTYRAKVKAQLEAQGVNPGQEE